MPDTNEAYLALITSEYSTKPLFNAYVAAFLNMISPSVDMYISFNTIFNVDNAVGDQLDQIGELLNISRQLPVVDENIPSVLTDEYYRTVIKAKIMSAQWDGTREGLEEILSTLLPNANFDIIDSQDMNYQVALLDNSLDATSQALLFQGYILPKPAGIGCTYNIYEKELFGWDSNTAFIKGWDQAEWGTT